MADSVRDMHAKVKRIVATQLSRDEDTIQLAQKFADLGVDELDLMEIVMRLEEQFGVIISDDEAQHFVTIESVSTYLNKKK